MGLLNDLFAAAAFTDLALFPLWHAKGRLAVCTLVNWWLMHLVDLNCDVANLTI
jgi:hypothetical protein